jgi:hypothetical protein
MIRMRSRLSEQPVRPAALLHHPQQRRTAAAMRGVVARGFSGFPIRHHGVAKLLQFLIGDAVAFHAVLENGDGDDMRGLVIPASGQGLAALLEGCENRVWFV